MNDDRELLELAALAAGIELDWDVPPKSPPWRMTGEGDDRGPASQWTPLTDSGDALDLAVTLGLQIGSSRFTSIHVTASGNSVFAAENTHPDPHAATRRAIVRAAADIGRAMKAHTPQEQK